MKKFSYLLAALVLCFPIMAQARQHFLVSKDMLDQVYNVTNNNYKPVVGNSVYSIKKKTAIIIVIRFYDANNNEADPEQTDMQAVFLKAKSGTKLVAITFSPVDVTKYIDLLVE